MSNQVAVTGTWSRIVGIHARVLFCVSVTCKNTQIYVYLYTSDSLCPFVPPQERSADQNIYKGNPINWDLGDPELDAGIERFNKFVSQTFWSISSALTACYAALSLAKRGRNITQMFFFWGPGGIGLSQFTKAIAEHLGDDNHKYLDGNVLFDDSELRKLIELVAAACCWTIQERLCISPTVSNSHPLPIS